MDSKRRKELADHAKQYTSNYKLESGLPDFEKIAASENIVLIYDNYEKAFEGLTVCENGKYFIHIDLDNTEDIESGRTRFTIAHELAHALIDEHRLGLLTNEIEPHVSNYLLGNDDKQIELEADYFASCLLMPEASFKSVFNEFKDPFSIETLKFLSRRFKTSLLATILRFIEIGSLPILATFNRDGLVKWYKKSERLPNWAFKFRVHESVPANTVVSDVFNDSLSHLEEIRKVDPDDWFYIHDDDFATYQLYEQCYFLKSYDYIVSIIWFQKN